jgi:hypothetical protein
MGYKLLRDDVLLQGGQRQLHARRVASIARCCSLQLENWLQIKWIQYLSSMHVRREGSARSHQPEGSNHCPVQTSPQQGQATWDTMNKR